MQSFKHHLREHVLSIGLNPSHESHREKHRQEMHDLIRTAYKGIGGYNSLGHDPEAESKKIHDDISTSHIKAVRRNGRISAVNLYRPQHGRKSVASATDGTDEGKKDLFKIKQEDVKHKRAWGEVSGKMEHLALNRFGSPKIKARHAKLLMPDKEVKPAADGYHYDRDIGGHSHTKIMVGTPRVDKRKK